MTTIVTRAGKGSPLTWNEVDNNFTNLNSAKYESGDSPSFAGLTLSTFTSGSVLFAGTSGLVSQDNANLFWDDTNNYLGIGTTSPTQKLDVSGAIVATGAFSGTWSAGQAYLDTTGLGINRVGNNYIAVGTSANNLTFNAPLYLFKNQPNTSEWARIDGGGRLLVGGTTSLYSGAKVQSFGTADDQFQGIRFVNGSANAAMTYLGKSRSGTIGTNTIVQSGDALGGVGFIGADGSSYVLAASVRGEVDGTPGLNDMPGRLIFSTTADGASSPTERMRIDSNGYVGIGNIVPSYLLEARTANIAGVRDIARFALTGNGGSGRGVSILLGAGGQSNSVDVARIVGYQETNSLTADNASLALQVANTSGTLTERMRIDSSGNLGLGVTPSAWNSAYKSVDVSNSSFMSGTGNYLNLASNAYTDGTWKYKATGSNGTLYQQSSGQHIFYTSASGTANAAITFTQAMTLDASAYLYVNTTGPQTWTSNTYSANSRFSVGGTGEQAIAVRSDDTNTTRAKLFVAASGGNWGLWHDGSALKPFVVGGYTTEWMRIDANGNMQMPVGAIAPYAPAPASISTTATLTNPNIASQIINTTGTSYTVTMPLGTTLETLITWSATNLGYDFYVVNTASGTITMAANTGVTTLGTLTIATGVSAHFRIRRTAANTYVLYRLS